MATLLTSCKGRTSQIDWLVLMPDIFPFKSLHTTQYKSSANLLAFIKFLNHRSGWYRKTFVFYLRRTNGKNFDQFILLKEEKVFFANNNPSINQTSWQTGNIISKLVTSFYPICSVMSQFPLEFIIFAILIKFCRSALCVSRKFHGTEKFVLMYFFHPPVIYKYFFWGKL